MTKDYILGGVANAHLFAGDDLFCDAITTLTDSGMNVSISAEEVRGGKGAALIGRYFHSSGMTLTLTNATFNMAYLAASVGADIEAGGDVLMDEQQTANPSGSATLSHTPVALSSCNGAVFVWYKKAGDTDAEYTKASATSATITGLEANAVYCFKYFYRENAASTITVKTDFVPKTLHLVLDANLYAIGDTAISGQTKVGTVIIDVPAFQLSGNQDLTMNMTGNASLNLEGTALAVKTCDAGCAGGKYYARIMQVITGDAWYNGINSIAADGGEGVQGAELNLYAIFSDKAPQKITEDMLTGLTLTIGTETIADFKYPALEGAQSITLADAEGTTIATGSVTIVTA